MKAIINNGIVNGIYDSVEKKSESKLKGFSIYSIKEGEREFESMEKDSIEIVDTDLNFSEGMTYEDGVFSVPKEVVQESILSKVSLSDQLNMLRLAVLELYKSSSQGTKNKMDKELVEMLLEANEFIESELSKIQ